MAARDQLRDRLRRDAVLGLDDAPVPEPRAWSLDRGLQRQPEIQMLHHRLHLSL
jgi:hypothetical protein